MYVVVVCISVEDSPDIYNPTRTHRNQVTEESLEIYVEVVCISVVHRKQFIKNRVHRKPFIKEHVHQKLFIKENVHRKQFINEHVHRKPFIKEQVKVNFHYNTFLVRPASVGVLCRACRLKITI